KAVAAVLLVVNELTKVDKHKLAKILFFADQKHLARYGRPITSDSYCKMVNGPVPSKIYDAVKGVVNPTKFLSNRELIGKVSVNCNDISPIEKPDMDQLSETDIECLHESISENAPLSFGQLTEKSHGPAWDSARKNGPILFTEIAKEGNASEFVMELIKMNLEAEELLRV
ncbi:MAG: Panacea domain-containing protein, partial [Bacteroidetes bacterium]|nr:Panacea domain-containing protein [Bacteroidota bacterium]